MNSSFYKTDAKRVQNMAKEYDQQHRGREHPGFSDYKVLVVQRLVMIVVGPALDTF